MNEHIDWMDFLIGFGAAWVIILVFAIIKVMVEG